MLRKNKDIDLLFVGKNGKRRARKNISVKTENYKERKGKRHEEKIKRKMRSKNMNYKKKKQAPDFKQEEL